MKPQNELALVVSYYLSRLDKQGYQLLGYKTFNESTREISRILSVKPNTIKNMRDEFDPYHQNTRIGWKRALRGSRLRIIEVFQNVDDGSLFEIVKEILNNANFVTTKASLEIHCLINEKSNTNEKTSNIYTPRGITGKLAEEIFIKYYKSSSIPVKGTLKDTRDLGCGYDFEVTNKHGNYYIEIKGLYANSGGILLTNKEWQTATKYKERYYLVLIKNISNERKIEIIQNPVSKLFATKSISTTIQVNWNISEKTLKNLL